MRLSRRQFLARSSAAIAATLVPAKALGRAGATAPSGRITMGFIGLGGQGSGHLLGGAWTYVPGGYVAREEVQVLAVCDVRRERRENALQKSNQAYAQRYHKPGYNGVQAYSDFREMLARPDIDAVLLALPYHWAAPMASLAMHAGKDVYCEKPCAITVREGQQLIEISRRYGRIFQAGTQQRSEYGGKFRTVCELVRNGRLGQLKEVYAYGQPGCFYPSPWTSDRTVAVPDGFDWDLWLGPLPWRPFGGEAGHALSGMFIGDVNWSPHRYDIINWTIDPDPTAPIEVWADYRDEKPENAIVHYKYTNGVLVHSNEYPGEKIGSEGGACFVGTEGRIAVERSNLAAYPARILQEPLRPADSRVYHANSHSGNFLECIRTRRQTICAPETAVYTMNTILIGGIALALKRRLTFDPAKAAFVRDDHANRLLSYTPRSPWHL